MSKYPLKCKDLGHKQPEGWEMILAMHSPAACGCFWVDETACKTWMVIDPLRRHPENPFDVEDYARAIGHIAHRIGCVVSDECPNAPHDIGLKVVEELKRLCPRIFGTPADV